MAKPRVPVIAREQTSWNRVAADATNRATMDIEGLSSSFDTLNGLFSVLSGKAVIWSAPVTYTADFAVAATDRFIINDKSGSTATATLPDPTTCAGRELTIQTYQAQTVVSAGSNVVPKGGGAAGTAIVAAVAGNWALLVSDGTDWIIMAGT